MSTRTLAILTIAVLALPAPALAFHNDEIPVLYTTSGVGSGSYAVKYEHPGGDFAIDLYGVGPGTSQAVSVGAFFFDANKDLQFGFAFTGLSSRDRLILSPAGLSGSPEALPDWLDASASTSGADAACTYACVGLTAAGAPAGTYYYLLWVAGVSANSIEVRSDAGDVTVNAGAAYAIADAEMEEGDANVQVGRLSAGAKAMLNVRTELDVEDRLWGFFGSADFKLACQFAVGACLWKSSLVWTCSAATGTSCDTTRTSYSGPSGTGTGFAGFLGTPGGDYTFTVDRKVDAYAPGHYDPVTGTFVFLGEDYTYLTAADNDLP